MSSTDQVIRPDSSISQVQVGAGGLKFDPQFINVTQPNTVVTFQFVAANHSVAQSTFATPCAPLANGFNSGFVPVGNGTGSWNLTVTDVNTREFPLHLAVRTAR